MSRLMSRRWIPVPASIAIGKACRVLTKLRGGSGSAFPGLVVERVDPQFLARALEKLPHGVVVVSGTNGKTTTTKMVVELLRGQGMRVFTNRSGSNFTRGVVASLLGEIRFSGRLDADIAVLELDEAHAVHFVKAVRPRLSLLLNVMRDQLDRFGEIDTTAGLLRTIAQHTTETVVLNREDARVAAIADSLDTQQVRYFGLAPQLRHHFPNDDELHSAPGTPSSQALEASQTFETPELQAVADQQTPHQQTSELRTPELHARTPPVALPEADVLLTELGTQFGSFHMGGQTVSTQLTVNGAYNTYNAAAALALVRAALGPEVDQNALVESLATVAPAFGRGESLTVQGQPLDLVLVKNPAGFRLGLSSFSSDGVATMIAINDNYADGRDMSWLWDVSFDSLRPDGVRMVSGVRSEDMALRLTYDDVVIDAVLPDLKQALEQFVSAHPDSPKRIFCTYTAMLALRRHLSAYTEVEAFA